MVRVAVFMAIYLISIAYALRCGGRPERAASLILTGGMMLTWLLISHVGRRFHGPELGVAFADTATLVALLWLALTADRFWPLWVAAMQTVVVLSHIAMVMKPFTLPTYYKNTIQLWIYPILLLVVLGTVRHRLRNQPSPVERSIGRFAEWCKGQIFRDRSRVDNRQAGAPN